MTGRWRGLLGVVLVAALAVTVLARMPRRAPSAAPAPAPRPAVELALTWRDGTLDPASAAVPKDHLVRLEVFNASDDTLALALAGYEDRIAPRGIAPGARWRGTFVADRPGEAFAWMVKDQPVGRLAVTGSHLEEGHR